jgi:hypothetical protein
MIFFLFKKKYSFYYTYIYIYIYMLRLFIYKYMLKSINQNLKPKLTEHLKKFQLSHAQHYKIQLIVKKDIKWDYKTMKLIK